MRLTKKNLIKLLEERPVLYQKEIRERIGKNMTKVNQAILALRLDDALKELFEEYDAAIRKRRSDEQKERMRKK